MGMLLKFELLSMQKQSTVHTIVSPFLYFPFQLIGADCDSSYFSFLRMTVSVYVAVSLTEAVTSLLAKEQ